METSSGRPSKANILRTVFIFTMSIISILIDIIFIGPILAIPAWVMAQKDLKKISLGLRPASLKGLTTAAWILSMIGTFAAVPSALFYFLY